MSASPAEPTTEQSHCRHVQMLGPAAQQFAEQLSMPDEIEISDPGVRLFEACLEGEVVYLPEIAPLGTPWASCVAEAKTQSVVVLPLLSEEEGTIMLLAVARREPEAFSSDNIDFLRQLSEHAALAARHAQLYAELEKAFQDLQRAQQRTLHQERLRAVGQMASGIAHDINNTLSPIVGFADLIPLIEPELSEQTLDYLKHIRTAGEDMSQIVARLRDFYRPRDAGQMTASIHLNRMIEQVLELTAPRWKDQPQQQGSTIIVETMLDPDLPPVPGHENEVRDALTNLILNAADAMPEGGILRILTEVTGECVRVHVQDTGIGMDKDTRAHCLEPFYTTKGTRGTGLGLATVYGTMQRHEGSLDIQSEPGEGTTVTLEFPIQEVADSSETFSPAVHVPKVAPLSSYLRI